MDIKHVYYATYKTYTTLQGFGRAEKTTISSSFFFVQQRAMTHTQATHHQQHQFKLPPTFGRVYTIPCVLHTSNRGGNELKPISPVTKGDHGEEVIIVVKEVHFLGR